MNDRITIDGLYTFSTGGEPRWVPIFQYKDRPLQARHALRSIIALDDASLAREGLDLYDDFRVSPPDEQPARRRKKARRDRSEGVAEGDRPQARKSDSGGRSGADGEAERPRKKKGKKGKKAKRRSMEA